MGQCADIVSGWGITACELYSISENSRTFCLICPLSCKLDFNRKRKFVIYPWKVSLLCVKKLRWKCQIFHISLSLWNLKGCEIFFYSDDSDWRYRNISCQSFYFQKDILKNLSFPLSYKITIISLYIEKAKIILKFWICDLKKANLVWQLITL